MAAGRIVGCPLPSPSTPYCKIERPGPGIGGRIKGWCLSDAILGTRTHFHESRTVPCTKRFGHCECCDTLRRKASWRGYLAVLSDPKKEIQLFELTPFAVRECRQFDDALSDHLRGRYLTLQRKGESAHGKVVASLGASSEGQRLPNEPDIILSLAAIWDIGPELLRRCLEGGAA